MLRQHSVIKTFRKLPDYIQQTVDSFLAPVVKKFEKSIVKALFQWFHFFFLNNCIFRNVQKY